MQNITESQITSFWISTFKQCILTINKYKEWSFDRICKVYVSDEHKILMDKSILQKISKIQVLRFSLISSIFRHMLFTLFCAHVLWCFPAYLPCPQNVKGSVVLQRKWKRSGVAVWQTPPNDRQYIGENTQRRYKPFNYTTITDRFRTGSSHSTGVDDLIFKGQTFLLPTIAVNSKRQRTSHSLFFNNIRETWTIFIKLTIIAFLFQKFEFVMLGIVTCT